MQGSRMQCVGRIRMQDARCEMQDGPGAPPTVLSISYPASKSRQSSRSAVTAKIETEGRRLLTLLKPKKKRGRGWRLWGATLARAWVSGKSGPEFVQIRCRLSNSEEGRRGGAPERRASMGSPGATPDGVEVVPSVHACRAGVLKIYGGRPEGCGSMEDPAPVRGAGIRVGDTS